MRRYSFALISVLVISAVSPAFSDCIPTTIPTAYDCIPNFGKDPTITSVGNGAWSNPGTWSPKRVPTDNDIVVIVANTNVIYDVSSTARIKTVSILSDGKLVFRTDINTKLMVSNLLVRGELEIGTAANTVAANITAEVVFTDTLLDTVNDPEFFGNGLVVLGKVTIHGAPKDETFVLTTAEPLKGQTSISVSGPINGWRIGDRVIVPDTRALYNSELWGAFVPQWENKLIAAIIGNSISLDSALVNDHKGWHRPDGSVEFFPHIANLTRNVRFSSENPNGVRGHTLFTYRADVDIRYAQFQNLGRTTEGPIDPSTNPDGRFPLHIYHLWGPINPSNTGYQFELIGNAIVDGARWDDFNGAKWGLVLTGSDFGHIKQNVVALVNGAGYVAYGESNSENEFVSNIAAGVTGHGSPRDNDGRGGEAFYSRGWHNTKYIDNVAASGVGMSQAIVAGSGYSFQAAPGSQSVENVRVALRRGADKKNGTIGLDYKLVDMGRTPIINFIRNMVYGTILTGLTIWNVSYPGETPYGESIIKDFTVWNMARYGSQGVFAYPIADFTFDGLIVRGQGDSSSGWHNGDYRASNIKLRNADIRGTALGFGGVATAGTILIEDSSIQVTDVGISFASLTGPGAGNPTEPRTIIVKNTKIDAWPGKTIRTISADYNPDPTGRNFILEDRLFVYDYKGIPNKNFQVFYHEQDPAWRPVPKLTNDGFWPGAVGTLEEGLSNQESANAYPDGITVAGHFYPVPVIAGSMATCLDKTTYPEIHGIVCPVGSNQHPRLNAGVNQTIVLPAQATLDSTVSDDGQPAPPAQVTVTWSMVSGPGTVTFGNPNTTDTTAAFSAAGIYVLRLTASDSVLSSFDDITITVKPVGSENTPPSVDAGPDQTVQGQADLDGSVADDGLPNPPGAMTVTWSQVSGPGTVTFGNPTKAKTTGRFPVAGVYVLRLTGNDSQSFQSDDVQITATAGSQAGSASGTHGDGLVWAPNKSAILPCSPDSVHIFQARNGRKIDADITDNAGLAEWKGKLRSGGTASAGMYGYECESPDGRKTGKLVLVK